ncbi:hypothetical protein [Fluviicola taffensis]|uniref:Uncharacterized protein n=1 Tax=Fluviicola taffensis (strain DSM 16823 / NCIMB 13979 / RW262) TaxID=755732 RepID=F2IIM1_FLUTR|nr:hypothetical protein [Fluviicola taffensis]AEA45983.1 hypothetical protein Fluta_4021 [Fluviicola taffensis DSM 16823]
MKSIKNFTDQKITNTHLANTKGGDIVTTQAWGGTDLRVGKTVYTNRRDGQSGNNDQITF